jgi:hypothetical protein
VIFGIRSLCQPSADLIDYIYYQIFSKNYISLPADRSVAMSESDSGTVAAYLNDNPRMMGVLFTMLLLLSQAGTVAASNGGGISGP